MNAQALAAMGDAFRAGDIEAAAQQLDTASAAEGFGGFAAEVLLGRFPRSQPAVPDAIAPLLANPTRADLPRLATALLRIVESPAEEEPRIEAACLLLEAGEPQLADAAMRPAWQPGRSPRYCRVFSGILAVLGRSEVALETARAAAAAAPGIAEYHVHHAGLLLGADQPAAALLAAGRAIGLRPEDAVGWRQASAALLALGHTTEAIEAGRRAAALSQEQAGFAEEVLVSAGAEALRRPKESGAPLPTAAAPARNWPGWAHPPEFIPQPPAPSLRQVAAARLRVLDALMLREARTFFTHSRLGYAWALFEPLMHVFALTVAMLFLGGSHTPPIGESMPVFYMTGVLPYLFFCHLTEKGLDLVHSQQIVLSLPQVTLADAVGASLLLRAATDLMVLVLSLLIFAAIGMGGMPHDVMGMGLAYGVLFLLSAGVAGINLGLSTISSVPGRLWPVVLRACYFLSGIFYHPDMMPTEFREWVLWNPLVHVIEWVRQSYYPLYVSPYLDMTYLLRCTLVALLLGTLVAAASSRRARLQH